MVNHTAVAAELAEAGGNHSGGHGHGSSGADSVSVKPGASQFVSRSRQRQRNRASVTRKDIKSLRPRCLKGVTSTNIDIMQ